jgi:SAM-dependent methyltransferase
MFDVAADFYVKVLGRLIADGTVSISDSVLVICGGPTDENALARAGFTNVTITNLDDGMSDKRQDAENLDFPDRKFDLVVVHAGLHHCRSPHRALLEMYRVAGKCALAFDARDSLLMRIAIRLGLTIDYELEAVTHEGFESGGLRNGPVPNFNYRWTERGVIDTIASYDPAYQQKIGFFYDLRIPVLRFAKTGRPILRMIGLMLIPFSRIFVMLAPKQCNEFAFAVRRTNQLQPWMETETRMSERYAIEHGRMYRS